eukprot:424_1
MCGNLIFQHRPVRAYRWDSEQTKWRGRGKGQLRIYYISQSGVAKIVFIDEKHEKPRLLQYINGKTKAEVIQNDDVDYCVQWNGADYTMSDSDPMVSNWKLHFHDEYMMKCFAQTFNYHIDAYNCVSGNNNFNKTIPKSDVDETNDKLLFQHNNDTQDANNTQNSNIPTESVTFKQNDPNINGIEAVETIGECNSYKTDNNINEDNEAVATADEDKTKQWNTLWGDYNTNFSVKSNEQKNYDSNETRKNIDLKNNRRYYDLIGFIPYSDPKYNFKLKIFGYIRQDSSNFIPLDIITIIADFSSNSLNWSLNENDLNTLISTNELNGPQYKYQYQNIIVLMRFTLIKKQSSIVLLLQIMDKKITKHEMYTELTCKKLKFYEKHCAEFAKNNASDNTSDNASSCMSWIILKKK